MTSDTKKIKIVFIRSDQYDVTPAVPRAIEAGKGIFHEFHILCWNRIKCNELKDKVVDGVHIRTFLKTAYQRNIKAIAVTIWYQLWLIWNLIKLNCDVIQVCDIQCALPAAFVAVLTRKRMIYDMRDPFALCYRFSGPMKKIFYALDWSVMGLSSGFVVPTSRYIPYMGRWGKSKREIFVIPNTCHDLLDRLPSLSDILPGRRDGIIRLTYLGYLDRSRGSELLFKFCRDNSNRTELLVAGGCYSIEIKKLIESTSNVIYLGKLPHNRLLSLIHEADAVTLFYDPQVPVNRVLDATKFYEAMMTGTPVLVSRGMSMQPVVSENNLGYVIEHGNVNELRMAVDKLRDTSGIQEMKKRCRQYYLDNLTLPEKISRYHEFYSRQINKWFSQKVKTVNQGKSRG